MRVFIAIDIPGEIQQRLSVMQDQLRQVSTSAKWVDPEFPRSELKTSTPHCSD